jgi:ABC-type transport system substrate-binding protein
MNAPYWSRLSRRRALSGAAALGLGTVGLALAGCSGSSKKGSAPSSASSGGAVATPEAPFVRRTPNMGPTPDEAKVNKDGTLHSRQAAIFTTINPYKGLDSGLLWGFTIYDHLWYVPADTGNMELFLAESFEQPDPLNFSFKIKQAYFHDKPPAGGRQVKATDIKASFEAAAQAPKISASPWWRQTLESVSAPDDVTVAFKLKQVDAWTFSSTNGGSVISSSILPQEMAAGPDSMDNNLVGSGRFQFVSHENGANFKLKRFDKWRIKGEPWLAGIEYRLLQEQSAALAAFAAQQIDGIGFTNRLERDQTVQQLGKSINVSTDPTAVVWMVVSRGDKEFADPRVRQAFYLALDRDEYIQLMFFGDAQKSGVVPPIHTRYALDPKELDGTLFKHDPAQAKQLLTASGFDTSREYVLKYLSTGDLRAQMAQITQAQMQKFLGIKLKLVPEDLNTWLQNSLLQSQFDFTTYDTLPYDDPSSYLNNFLKGSGRAQNFARFFDDDVDAMIQKQRSILDTDQRAEAIKEIQRQITAKFAPEISICSPVASAASWAYVKGQVVGRGSYGLFSGRTYIDKS